MSTLSPQNSKFGSVGKKEHWKAKKNDIIIAVMGRTGAGKTSFIGHARNDPALKTGKHDVPRGYRLHGHPRFGERIVLVDTPGFDGNQPVEDEKVVKKIQEWYKNNYKASLLAGGILYLHNLNDTRTEAASPADWAHLSRLFGPSGAVVGRLVVVTSHWHDTDGNEALLNTFNERKEELSEKWKSLIGGEPKHTAFLDTPESVQEALELLLSDDAVTAPAAAARSTSPSPESKSQPRTPRPDSPALVAPPPVPITIEAPLAEPIPAPPAAVEEPIVTPAVVEVAAPEPVSAPPAVVHETPAPVVVEEPAVVTEVKAEESAAIPEDHAIIDSVNTDQPAPAPPAVAEEVVEPTPAPVVLPEPVAEEPTPAPVVVPEPVAVPVPEPAVVAQEPEAQPRNSIRLVSPEPLPDVEEPPVIPFVSAEPAVELGGPLAEPQPAIVGPTPAPDATVPTVVAPETTAATEPASSSGEVPKEDIATLAYLSDPVEKTTTEAPASTSEPVVEEAVKDDKDSGKSVDNRPSTIKVEQPDEKKEVDNQNGTADKALDEKHAGADEKTEKTTSSISKAGTEPPYVPERVKIPWWKKLCCGCF